MTLVHARTNGRSLRAALAAAFAPVARAGIAAFEWAERSPHHRLGSAFLSPEALCDLRLEVEKAYGQPCK